jgi:hypothetical protein
MNRRLLVVCSITSSILLQWAAEAESRHCTSWPPQEVRIWPVSAAKADGRIGGFLGYSRRGAFTR